MRFVAVVVLLGACGRFGFDTPRGTGDADTDAIGDGTPDAPDRANRMFLTTGAFTGDLGGVSGANQKCQDEANAATLGGTWVALIYTLADDPSVRLAGSRGWVDVTGTPIADTPADLVNKQLNPLRVDAHGNRFTRVLSWWGGPPSESQTCTDWTSNDPNTGIHVVESDSSFHTDNYSPCSASSNLICAEIGHVAPVIPPVATGRNAFVSKGTVIGSIGITGADMLCQTEAAAVPLPGTYRAYLSTNTTPADARFSTTGPPWRRVDGALLAATAAQLFGTQPQDPWDTFIARHADGSETNARIWTGNTTVNCQNWTTANNAFNGLWGGSQSSLRARINFAPTVCSSAYALLCFQQ